jgi:hypothetical protein
MVGQLTLDQHIGVRIPGGQPNILFTFYSLRVIWKTSFDFPALLVRLVCVRGRHFPGSAVESVDPSNIFPGNQVTVNIDCHLDAAVAHLLLNMGGRDAGLNQQRAESVAQVMKAEFPKP